MTEQEIKEAVQELENCLNKYGAIPTLSKLKPLLTLAEEYLALKGWPEEEHPFPGSLNSPDSYSVGKREGFNEALRLCKFAAMKERNKVNRGAIEIIIYDNIGKSSYSEDIVKELLELINGKDVEK